MTEKVIYVEHPERAAEGGSSLCNYYMKTIPELCVEEGIYFEALPYGVRYRPLKVK